MSRVFRKWKLGWKVLARYLHFSIIWNILGLVLVPVSSWQLLGEDSPLLLRVLVILFCTLYFVAVFPFTLYWSASWTGRLQGSDEKEFRKLYRSGR